uniref:Uncharacterized protein n=1 Tax=Caenorhabditis angaria TaxID=860376 RepID=B6VBS8_9PELO|nr:hypothetical protein Csp3_JD01.003 [Caenorhabditis angaria]
MKLFFELKDQDDVIHQEFQYEFDSHKIFLNFEDGNEIVGSDERSLESSGMKHGCKVIVRHSLAANWEKFLEFFELARQALKSNDICEIERNVDLAMDQLNPLNEALFSVTFSKYDELRREFTAKFRRYIDKEMRYMEYSMHDYYSKIFVDDSEGSKLDILCQKTCYDERRVQGKIICQVSRNETSLANYYMKKHTGRSELDIREFFVRKLFELMKVGPTVHFIPNTHSSGNGLYIVNENVDGFRGAYSEGFEMSKELHAQRKLLTHLLYLRGIREQYYGIDGNGRLCIIDCDVKGSKLTMAHNRIVEHYLKSDEESEELRTRVAKDCIKSWNLLESFDQAHEEIVKKKELFEIYPISNEPNHNFDEYFVYIKNNLNNLIVQLN